MARTILIVSGKGGVGKTTTAINLASALQNFGKNVLVVDSAITTPDLGLHLGSPVTPINFHDVLAGKARPKDAVYLHSSGLKVLPGSISLKDMKRARAGKMKKSLASLKRHVEFMIIDSAAGFSKETIDALEASSEVIVVTNPDLPSVTNALKATKIAESLGKIVLGVIVTKRRGKHNEMSLRNISHMLETEILGAIPEDEKVRTSLAEKNILIHSYPRSRAARAYKQIAARLIGKKHQEQENFFENMLKVLGLVR